jgi:tetratricopeptide (TPR) repeat protein
MLAVLSLVALTCVTFWPILNNGFVNWDDPANYLTNGHLGFSTDDLTWAWTTFHLGAYEPLAWMVSSAEYIVWQFDPRWYHAVSIGLHAATAVAVYLLTVRILRLCRAGSAIAPTAAAAVSTAWFAVHPQRVEVVAWITAQPNLLCALFGVCSILAYLHSVEPSGTLSRRWLNGSLALFVASLLSKAPAVSLPVVLLVLDVYPLRRMTSQTELGQTIPALIREKVWFFLFSAVFSVLAFLAKARTFNGVLLPYAGFGSRVIAAAYSTWFYLSKLAVPSEFLPYYRLPGPVIWRNSAYLVPVLLLSAISLLLLLGRKWLPNLLATWAVFLIILSPVSGFISMSTQLVADRHAYLASMAWCPLLAYGLTTRRVLRARWTRVLAAATCVLAIAWLTTRTHELVRTWHDSEALWQHALDYESGRTMMAFNNLASAYLEKGKVNEALNLYRSALVDDVNPTDLNGRALVLFNFADVLVRLGRNEEAIEQYQRMAEIAPLGAETHYRWGVALERAGRFTEATIHFNQALKARSK